MGVIILKKKEDRRVKLTKMFLKESLIELLLEKEINKITIKEICENADVNRATFYSHYKDQNSLLESIQEEFIEDIIKQLPDKNIEEIDPINYIINILYYIKDNVKLSTLLLGEKGNMPFQKEMMEILYDKLHSKMFLPLKINKSKEKFVSSFVITGTTGIIQNWIKNGLKQTPEEIADIIGELSLLIAKHKFN